MTHTPARRPARPNGQKPNGNSFGRPKRGSSQNRSFGGSSRSDRPSRAARGAAAKAAVSAPLAAALDAAMQAPVPEDREFGQFGMPQALVTALARRGMQAPFAIQTRVLPDALAGRDVLGRAQTGSGKTLAFGLPVLARLQVSTEAGTRREPNKPRSVILVPTRELARQVADAVQPLAHSLDQRVTTVVGGLSMAKQIDALRRGVDVLVATPGRLIDLMERNSCDLSAVEISVLDEADHMADLGFLPAVRRILDATPKGAQRLLLSATLDGGVAELVNDYLVDPTFHAIAELHEANAAMQHTIFNIEHNDKVAVATEIAGRPARTLFFVRTKHGADRLAKQLSKSGAEAVAIHGNLNQNQRQRALDAFSAGRSRVLVATDVAARGIHVDDVDLVVHYDLPADHKDYLHRSGRTARAGASGTVVAFADPSQRRVVARLHEDASVSGATTHRVHPGHEAVRELAASGEPIVVRELPAKPERSRSDRPQRPGRSSRPRWDGTPRVAREGSRDGAPHARRDEGDSRPYGRPRREGGPRRVARGRATVSVDSVDRLWTVLDEKVRTGHLPGFAAAVRTADGEFFQVGGRVAVEDDSPAVTPDTQFRIASLTKPVGGALALALVADGVLALDDPVGRWLPELAEPRVLLDRYGPVDGGSVPAARSVTVRDLLTCTSGWGITMEDSPRQKAMSDAGVHPGALPPPLTRDEFVARVGEIPLAFQPGEGWLYDTGFDLLGVLLARAAGVPLHELMASRIFTPLGMSDTGFWAADPARLATLYLPVHVGLTVMDPPDGLFASPPLFEKLAGGMVSTIGDVLRFYTAMADGGAPVLAPESVAAMTSDQLTVAQREQAEPFTDEGRSWGYGTAVDVEVAKPWMSPGRWGWTGGTGTTAEVDPVRGTVGVLLTQRAMTGPLDSFDYWWEALAGL